MSLPFLLEIGSEEIPDWMIEPALAEWKRMFTQLLAEHALGGEVTRVEGTPRRLVLFAEGLQERQADREETVLGPAVSAALKDGKPTGAAQGFAKKMGVSFDELGRESNSKGEYLSFRKRIHGRTTADVLTEQLPLLIPAIPFPKTMYWTGRGGPRFIRPIRWVLALLGEQALRFTVADAESGDVTFGHRRLSSGPLPVTIDSYEETLADNGVILSSDKRRARIEQGIEQLLADGQFRLRPDAGLLNTLVYLTEYPTPILGTFDPAFLALPSEVLVTVMRHHQRYFSLRDHAASVDQTEKLAAAFVTILNTDGDPDGLIQRGNERVLKARFEDARFFYEVDGKRTLESRLTDLEHITFQAKLGSYREKTQRVVDLTGHLAPLVGANEHMAQRAALLCKCDLPTEMVKEFTDLQGFVGGLYAQRDGEPSEVWEAVYDHYLPLSMDDKIPATLCGRVVALADKTDTLRGCFAIGLIPSGSKDPFGLRRAAQGVVKILVEGELFLPLPLLCAGDAQLEGFLLDRVRYYFREVRGFAYDEVNAVLAASSADLPDAMQRLQALKLVRTSVDFEPLAASFKRIRNILKQGAAGVTGVVDAALLETGPEAELYEAARQVSVQVSALRHAKQYREALQRIASLRPAVDRFFDHVLVNADDAAVRTNRYQLLQAVIGEASTIADLSEIVSGV